MLLPARRCYLLAGTVLEHKVHDPARRVMLDLLGSQRTNKLHRHEMDRLQQQDAAHRVADIECIHVVAVGTPVPVADRNEPARHA